jgi:hypothetical protein
MAGCTRLTFDLVAECLSWFGRRGSTVVHRYVEVDGTLPMLDSRSPGHLYAHIRIVEEAPPGVLSVSVSNRGNGTWLA